jgi:hypothetical protein
LGKGGKEKEEEGAEKGVRRKKRREAVGSWGQGGKEKEEEQSGGKSRR